MQKEPLLTTQLSGIKLFKKGKVRDIYSIGNFLLIIATDRISAFDVIMPNGIPHKGRILTTLSTFWFDFTRDITPNHLIASDISRIISLAKELAPHTDILKGRSMLVKKSEPIPIECVVRGYLAGSSWKEYKEKESICGIKLPSGLQECENLKEPIFTPATKATSGHDENITEKNMRERVGEETFEQLRRVSLALYEKASAYAETKGIIISDTKFEFGKMDEEIILIDELLTPDSSRFWPEDEYRPGKPQRSFDKQFLRDYLEDLDWDKTPPGPPLPAEIVKKTGERYLQALKIITGKDYA